MASSPPDALRPRKTARQARSRATIDALLEATIQVLVAHGARGLSTTRVAERAGVSVGTLYQYFPHKKALLYAAVGRYLDEVVETVEAFAEVHRGRPLAEASDALVTAYVDAKSARPDAALALYRASSEMDVAGLTDAVFARLQAAAVRLFSQAPDAAFDDLDEVAFTVLSAVTGATRLVFETDASPERLRRFRARICEMSRAYLDEAKLGHGDPGPS